MPAEGDRAFDLPRHARHRGRGHRAGRSDRRHRRRGRGCGWRRVRAARRQRGIVANRKRIRRLLREHSLQPRSRRRFARTTGSDHDQPIFPDRTNGIRLDGPNQLWVAIGIPLLHIADPTAERIKAAGLSRLGLLGAAFTMEQAFYKGRLAARFGLDVLVAGEEDRAMVHRVIYDEPVQGRVEPASRDAYRDVIACLVARR